MENKLNNKVTFRVNDQKWEEFKKKCGKYNLSASVVLRQFVKEFDNTVKIPDIFKEDHDGKDSNN